MYDEARSIPVKKALFLILFSMVVTTLLFFCGCFYFRYIGKRKSADAQLSVRVIAQHCYSKEPLLALHLSEMVGLSVDKPVHLYGIKKELLEARLRSFPIVKEASVRLLEPGVVFIDYSLREPIAFLADYENRALDDEGYIFPVLPYLAPKILPELILGSSLLQEEVEQEVHKSSSTFVSKVPKVQGMHIKLAFSILQYLKQQYSHRGIRVLFVDVQKAFLPSADQEIVLGFMSNKQYLVRINSSFWKEGIQRFFFLYPLYIESALKKQALKQNSSLKPAPLLTWTATDQVIVDLRMPKLANIST